MKELDRHTDSLENCSFVKTVLMFAVFFYHSCLFMANGWFTVKAAYRSSVLMKLADWLNSFHIYAFVLVSGFIFCSILEEKGGYASYGGFLLKKIRRLIVPAVFVTLIWVIPVSLLFWDYSFSEIAEKFILALAPNQLWFLWMLFWVFLISWPLFKFVRSRVLTGVAAVILYLAGSFGGKLIPNWFQFWTGCEYVIYFWIGVMLRRYRKRIGHMELLSAVLIVLDVLLWLLARRIEPADTVTKALSFALNSALHAVGAVMAFLVLQTVASYIHVGGRKEKSLFRSVSDSSMTMFLFHQQIVYFAIYAFNGRVGALAQTLLNFASACVISFLLSAVLLRWRPLRFLLGEK